MPALKVVLLFKSIRKEEEKQVEIQPASAHTPFPLLHKSTVTFLPKIWKRERKDKSNKLFSLTLSGVERRSFFGRPMARLPECCIVIGCLNGSVKFG